MKLITLNEEKKEALASIMTLISKADGAEALKDYRYLKQLKENCLDHREVLQPSAEVLKLVDIILSWNKVIK